MVTLVDKYDNPIGSMSKMEAHEKGLLHRAFSLLIFNTDRELLLQKRAPGKYHSGGLWTNSCCSHPAPGEEISYAAAKRLKEEMGISSEITPLTTFIYHAYLDNGLQEHELDHIYIGISNEQPQINPEEVSEYKYLSIPKIRQDIQDNENAYTEWFKIIIHQITNDKYYKKFMQWM